MLTSCFNSYTIDEVDDDGTFTIDFDHPEKNQHGYFCIKPQRVVRGNERFDTIVIYKALYDPRDLNDTSNFQMELLPDRTGVIVTEPAVPYGFIHDVLEIHAAEAKRKNQCDITRIEHQVQASSLLQNPTRLKTVRVIKFPSGVTCSADFSTNTNNKKASNKLQVDPNCRFLTHEMTKPTSEKVSFLTGYVFWKLTIDGSACPTDEKSGKPKDLLVDAFDGMSMSN